ncbi:GSCOCT00013091001.2-RA-CDS [Cotesia congregata]|uniref:Cc_bv6.20_32.17 n=2 Tax=root TaxID=1 RepID=S6CVR6_COTCN|nr:GSCOCT00013091001.2-RA-CDS [Cotesia congregata]CAG5092525.1 cc_bv6.20_32.17 [Cotesia congregata]CCQ71247.1 hypothetical protein BV6-20 [Cotesia congregata]
MPFYHRVYCWVPRSWLSVSWEALQKVLVKEISEYYMKYGRAEGSAVRINGTTARLQLHNETYWMRDDLDLRTIPNLKDYYTFQIPCVHCNRL